MNDKMDTVSQIVEFYNSLFALLQKFAKKALEYAKEHPEAFM